MSSKITSFSVSSDRNIYRVGAEGASKFLTTLTYLATCLLDSSLASDVFFSRLEIVKGSYLEIGGIQIQRIYEIPIIVVPYFLVFLSRHSGWL